MSFQSPSLLWFLLFVPALVAAYIWVLRRKKKEAIRYPSLGSVRDALGRGQHRRHIPAALLLIGLAAALLGIARPIAVVPALSNQQTIVLAIDVSRSMRATDVDPTRISAAQAAAKTFLQELPPEVRVGIVSFAATAAAVQVPTQNREELLAAVDRLQLEMHTATGSGLVVALAMLLPESGIDVEKLTLGNSKSWQSAAAIERNPKVEKKTEKAEKTFKPVPAGSYESGAIVLLSDGRRTMGPDPLEIAKMAADRGVKVFTVGFGTLDGGKVDFGGYSIYMKLDEATLRQVADLTRGEYFHAGTALELKKVYQHLTSRLVLEKKKMEITALFAAVGALLVFAASLLSLLWFHRAV